MKHFILFCIAVFTITPLWAQEPIQNDYFDMSLEDLMNVEVVTASKKSQKATEAPVPVYVITREELKIYGANNVGEALRMVPGIEVVQGGNHDYQIAIRGLGTTAYNASNKVLFLVNGRSMYNESFGGVRMQALNITIDEIERIEVVRGAGSALYGANAFSGIVNIITRKTTQQEGVHIGASYGNLNQMQGNVRWGQKLSDKLSYRVTAGYSNIDQAKPRFDGDTPAQRQEKEDLGYRLGTIHAQTIFGGSAALTYELAKGKVLEVSGGYSDNTADVYYVYPGEFLSKDYFGQVNYTDSSNSFRAFYNGESQGRYDLGRFMRKGEPTNPYLMLTQRPEYYESPEGPSIRYQTFDGEYQRNQKITNNLNVVVGAWARSNLANSVVFSPILEAKTNQQNFGAVFTQIEYKPIENLTLIAGGRADYNTVIGANYNPRLTALYRIGEHQSIRVGAGTSTRNPHLFDLYLDSYVKARNLSTATGGLNPVLNLTAGSNYALVHALGNQDTKSEQMRSLDLGYQVSLNKKIQIKIDGFYNTLYHAINFTSTTVTSKVEVVENIHGIFAAQGANVTTLMANNMNMQEMQNTINTLNGQIAFLQQNDPNNPNLPQLMAASAALAGTPTQPGLIALYGTPKELTTSVYNTNDVYNFYGGEVSAFFVPTKKFSVTANYAYLKFDDKFNERIWVGSNEPIYVTVSPEHKVNLAVKYQFHKFYAGAMFNYMSKTTRQADNNKNGVYDIGDKAYENKGILTVNPRENLNVNIGFRHKNIDVYATGFNLIQDDYLQLTGSNTVTGGDLINRRFLAGVRLDF